MKNRLMKIAKNYVRSYINDIYETSPYSKPTLKEFEERNSITYVFTQLQELTRIDLVLSVYIEDELEFQVKANICK